MSSRTLEALDLQVAEVEMLSSMYPNTNEFVLDDPVTIEVIKAVVNGELEISSLESRIGFTIHVVCSDKGKTLKVSLICQMPHEYPFVKPQVYIQTLDPLPRERQKCLREDLDKEVESQEEGDIIFGVVIEWLKERLYEELAYVGKENKQSGGKKNHGSGNKFKRKDIQDWGLELKLHGFFMPGKPGVICAEGCTEDVDEFWYRIRRMNWKKICIKEQEVMPIPVNTDVSSLYKFDTFSELVLDARGGKGREYHMDLGQFNSYLHQHGSGQIFSLFFGLEGKFENEVEDNERS